MPAAQRTLTIDRPPSDVFAFLTDPRNDQRWRRHVTEIAVDGPLGVGTSIHQVVKGPAGRPVAADMQVTAYEPPTRYAFQVTAGPVRPAGEFLFADVANGTRVSFSLSAELRGIKKVLMAKAVQRSMDSEVAALDRAKALIESD